MPDAKKIALELAEALRDLLGTCELNMDDMESETLEKVEWSESVLACADSDLAKI